MRDNFDSPDGFIFSVENLCTYAHGLVNVKISRLSSTLVACVTNGSHLQLDMLTLHNIFFKENLVYI